MKKLCFLAVFLMLSQAGLATGIIPSPKRIIHENRRIDWNADYTLFTIDASVLLDRHPVTAKALQLIRELPLHFSSEETDVKITLLIKGQNQHVDRQIASTVEDSLLEKDEGYYVRLDQDHILIYGFDQAGLLYGVQSLRQLVGAFVNRAVLSAQTIIDYPSFAFRGIMDDISRGPLSNVQFLRQQVERLSLLKINVFSFYIEHVLKTRKHYAFAPEDALTISELRELAVYADSFNIRLMGSFQSLGHFKHILSNPDYQHLGVSERMLKPADSTSRQFLFDIYEELIPVSGHPFFHINCDEAYDLDRGESLQSIAKAIGKGQVYMNHVKPLMQYLEGKGKIPALWGDMLLQYPEMIDRLPKNCVVFSWNYDARENFDDFIQPFVQRSIPIVVTSGVVNSYRIWPDLVEAAHNIRHFSYQGWKAGAVGMLTTVWDDGGHHFFHCDWYGVTVSAEHSWNPGNKDNADFARKYFSTFYLGSGHDYQEFAESLAAFQKISRLRKLDNALIRMQYEITETDGMMDTTDFQTILNFASKALNHLERIIGKIPSTKPLFSADDFHYWQFKIEELKESVMSAQSICEITSLKNNLYNSDQMVARKIDSMAQERMTRWIKLKEQFRDLWYRENRDYFYAEGEKKLDGNIGLWKDLSNLARAQNLASLPRYTATSDTYFHYWLSAGPFFEKNRESIDTDYFRDAGGEESIRPAAIDFYKGQDGQYESWKKIISSYPDHLDFNEFYPGEGTKVVYIHCQLYSEKETVLTYELRTKGKHRVFLNGQLVRHEVHDNDITDGELTLIKGRNNLTIKLMVSSAGTNDFSFFLPGKKIISEKYRYYLQSTD